MFCAWIFYLVDEKGEMVYYLDQLAVGFEVFPKNENPPEEIVDHMLAIVERDTLAEALAEAEKLVREDPTIFYEIELP